MGKATKKFITGATYKAMNEGGRMTKNTVVINARGKLTDADGDKADAISFVVWKGRKHLGHVIKYVSYAYTGDGQVETLHFTLDGKPFEVCAEAIVADAKGGNTING